MSKIKTKKAAKSKMATILKRKDKPKINPDRAIRINLWFKIFFSVAFNIKMPATIFGKSIKFSALAILPSISGKPKRTAKTPVAIKTDF